MYTGKSNDWMRHVRFACMLVLAIVVVVGAAVVPHGGNQANALNPASFKLNVAGASASGYDGSNTPQLAVDGSLTTRWAEDGIGAWLQVDLGSVRPLDYVKLAFYSGHTRTYSFDLLVSSDGTNWTTVLNDATSGGASENLETFDFTDTNGRYIRYVHNGYNNGMIWVSLYEIEVYGGVSSGPSGKLQVAAATASESSGANTPNLTIDGNLTTRWAAEGIGEWITWDLGSVRPIHYVKLAFYSGHTRTYNFDLLVSDNGTNWTTVLNDATNGGASEALETFDFADTSGRYIRYVHNGYNGSMAWISLYEAEIYGEGDGGNPPSGTNECDNPKPEWIFCDDFEQDRLDQYFEYNDGNNDQFLRTAGVGLNGSYAMRAVYPTNSSEAGNLKLSIGRNPLTWATPSHESTQDFREIYYRFYMKNSANWDHSGSSKVTRATVFARPNMSQAMIAHLWSEGGSGTDIILDAVRLTDASGNVTSNGYNDVFSNPGAVWLGQSPGVPFFDSAHAGNWYAVEVRVKLNDPGQSNGVFEYWIDDVLQESQTGLNFVSTYTDYGINTIMLENYLNNFAPFSGMERYYDNFVVSTERIGLAGSGGNDGGGNDGGGNDGGGNDGGGNDGGGNDGGGNDGGGNDDEPVCEAVNDGECFYIAATPGTGSGTYTDPFGLGDLPDPNASYCALVSAALEALGPGDVLYFREGSYNVVGCPGANEYRKPYIRPAQSGTPGSPITIRAYPGENVVLNYVSGTQPLIGTYYMGHVRFIGFTLNTGNRRNAVSIYGSGSTGIEVAYNRINGQYAATVDNHNGMLIENASNIHVHHNIITGVKGDSHNSSGIKVYKSTDLIVEDNYIYDNTVAVFDKDSGYNNVYRRNYFTGNDNTEFVGNNQYDQALFYIYDNVIDGKIELLSRGSGHRIHDNLFRNTSEMAGAWNVNVDSVHVWNNVAIANGSTIRAFYLNNNTMSNGLDYLDYNFYTATPDYRFMSTIYSLSQMRSNGYEIASRVLTGAAEMYVDQVNYEVRPQMLTAGRYGDVPGPDNVALILDTSRYGPSALQ